MIQKISVSTGCAHRQAILRLTEDCGAFAAPAGCSLPDLELEGGQVVETDERGSAYIGDVSIVEESGKVSREAQQPGCPPGAMDLQLCAELAEGGNADSGWVLSVLMHYKD